MEPEVEGRVEGGATSSAHGGVVAGIGPDHAASGWSASAPLASRFRGVGSGTWDRGRLPEAALRAAGEGMAGLGAPRRLPGVPAPQLRDAAAAGGAGTRAEGPPRPLAPLEARGECTRAAPPALVAAVGPSHLVVTSESTRRRLESPAAQPLTWVNMLGFLSVLHPKLSIVEGSGRFGNLGTRVPLRRVGVHLEIEQNRDPCCLLDSPPLF